MAKTGSKKQPAKTSAVSGRVRKLTKKQAKQSTKKKVKNLKPIPGSFKLTRKVFSIFIKNWKTLAGIVFVYLLLNIVLASGLSNLSGTVDNIKADLGGNGQAIVKAITGFSTLVGSAGSSGSATGSTFQSILFVLESLVIIWALRHLLAGTKITVKQAYYQSMSPLIPFILVILVVIIQLLPITLGATVLTAIASSAILNAGLLTGVSVIVFLLLGSWSLYLVSASIFAVYIVTLPDMQPRQALRSSKDLVRYRRWSVIRKILFLPIFILLAMGVLIIPLILYLPIIVPEVFYALGMLAILFVHTYLYSLYRELLA